MMIYIWLLLASFIWGSNVLVMRYMLQYTTNYFLAGLKVLLSILTVLVLMKYQGVKFKHSHNYLGLRVSFFVVTFNFMLTFAGLNLVSGSNNAIINSLAPLVTILLAKFFYREKLVKNQIMAMLVALFAFFVSTNFRLSISWGQFLLLGGIAIYSYGNLLIQHNCNKDSKLSFTLEYLGYGFIELLLIFILNPNCGDLKAISWWLWLLFVLFSGVGFGVIQLIYFQAIQEIGSIKTSFLLGLNPLFTYLGALILGEEFQWYLLFAMVLMLCAILIANKKIVKTIFRNNH